MRDRNIAGATAALVILCLAGVFAWRARESARPAASPAPSVTPPAATPPASKSGAASSSPAPQVYVIAQHAGSQTPPPNPHGSGSATVTQPSSALLSTPIPDFQAQQAQAAYSPPPPPVIVSERAAPQIISLSISTPVVHSGETVSGKVETSTNVASVEARIGGYSSNLRKTGAGRFSLDYRVPYVPFFMKRTYTVLLIARNTRGDAVSTSFPITVR